MWLFFFFFLKKPSILERWRKKIVFFFQGLNLFFRKEFHLWQNKHPQQQKWSTCQKTLIFLFLFGRGGFLSLFVPTTKKKSKKLKEKKKRKYQQKRRGKKNKINTFQLDDQFKQWSWSFCNIKDCFLPS